jgi:hypothetical protein
MRKRTLTGLCVTFAGLAWLAATAAAQTPHVTTHKIAGAPTVTTEKISGEVVKDEGGTLVVKMASGALRTFNNVPESRTAIVDGKEVAVRDLQPGTRLTATITKTTTPVTVRTTTVSTGKVWHVMGNSVILTLPDGQNKQFTVKPDYKFNVNGAPATVHDLKPGMTVSAEKIVEAPTVEIATNTKVIGHVPAPAQPAPTPAKVASRTPAHAQPAPVAEPAPGAAPAPVAAKPAHKLPKTASSAPLAGLLGLLFVSASFALRLARRW